MNLFIIIFFNLSVFLYNTKSFSKNKLLQNSLKITLQNLHFYFFIFGKYFIIGRNLKKKKYYLQKEINKK